MLTSGRLHAEVAGAGIAGLGVSTLLANRGWSVRAHERSSEIRELGAGIYLRNNSLRVLEELGVADRIQAGGLELKRSLWRDGRGKILQDHRLSGDRRMWMAPRQLVIQSLADAARQAGVEVKLESEIAGADSGGELLGTRGESYPADLVIGADGQASAVRDALGLTRKRVVLSSMATRFLVPSRAHEPEDNTTMYWSGRRRVGVSACGEDQTYVYMIAGEDDLDGVATPIDVESWSRSFPVLSDLFETLAGLPAIQHHYILVTSSPWQRGRAAIIGDAAHGLPPVLGQGAGLALSNAWALANLVEGAAASQMPAALKNWESRYRAYADTTQSWSVNLDRITRYWPGPLLSLRAPALVALGRLGPMQRKMRVADGFPIGS